MADDMQWSRRFRPTTFDEMVVGNPEILGEAKMATKKTLAMIIAGEHGTGKTTLARILSNEINGSQQGVIEEPSTDRGVGYIRMLQDRVKYSPPHKKWVVIVDEAHNLTKDAYTALLKLLEDPPHSKILFVLCTNRAHKIPKEVVRRCKFLAIEKPESKAGVSHLMGVLKQVKFKGEKADLLKLCRKALTDANFGMGQAIENLESMHDKIKSGATIQKILSGKASEGEDKEAIGDVEMTAGKLLLAITDDSKGAALAANFILATMSHCDVVNVIERMAGILYYGHIADKGGKWNWQSKPYKAIFKKPPPTTTVISLVNELNEILNLLRNSEVDPALTSGPLLARMAFKYRKN